MNSPTPKPRSTAGYLNNFRDPVGLAKRMLFSGNRAAHWAIGREALRPLMMPADVLLRFHEQRRLANCGELTKPVVLIVGPPRGGTTVLYQLLANCLDATWFPNVSEMFPRSPITASRLLAWKRNKSRKLRSFYGQTAGFSAPNDGFHIWNRWLGKDRYEPDLLPGAETRMLQFLAAWTNTFNKPLINKNNRNTLCLPVLDQTIPTAHFVVLQREPSDIARSLIRAREFVQGDKHGPWGLASQADHAEDPLGYVDDVCEQIENINLRLADGTAAIEASRLSRFTYEELCADPQQVIETIGFRSGVELRSGPLDFGDLKPASRHLLSDPEEARLAEHLDRVQDIRNTASPSQPSA